jgi:hypothetical protein
MFRNPDSAAHGVPLLFNLAFLAALLMLFTGRNFMVALVDLSGRAVTCVGGYLRPRPDPWLEHALRDAFAEIDHDLIAVLHHDHGRR